MDLRHRSLLCENNPTVPANEIWAHLVDDHDTTVSYGAVRAYVTKRKAQIPVTCLMIDKTKAAATVSRN